MNILVQMVDLYSINVGKSFRQACREAAPENARHAVRETKICAGQAAVRFDECYSRQTVAFNLTTISSNTARTRFGTGPR
jgi:hypothetical protein